MWRSTFSNRPLRHLLIKLQILNLLSFVINVCWETPQSGEIKSSYLFVSSHFFYRVDILDFFADNIYGDQSVRMLYQLGEENSTETRFQKIIRNIKQAVPLLKKKGHIINGPVRGGNVRLGLQFDIKLNTFRSKYYVTLT